MPIIEVKNVSKTFRLPHGQNLKAVDDVSFSVEAGECLGVIGESGSGKSTLGRLLLRLHEADGGQIKLEGQDILALSNAQMRRRRKAWQVVFQEPFASLNPRLTIRQIVEEPLIVAGGYGRAQARLELVAKTLEEVGLSEDFLDRRPASLSGGQQQRVGIGRALVTSPSIVVLDEPTSSLDLTIRASVLRMLARLQESRGLTYVFISHDMDTVRHFCTRVAVMRNGKFVEEGATEQVLEEPRHAYTQTLMKAAMKPIPFRGQQGRNPGAQVLETELR